MFTRLQTASIVPHCPFKRHQRRTPIWQWGPDIAPTIYVHLSSLVLEYWFFVGTCTRQSYSKSYYLCHLASLFNLLPSPIPPPRPFRPPLLYVGSILMNSMKKLSKTGHYLLAKLVVQKLIDN